MKKIFLSFICGIVFIIPSILASNATFSDVNPSDWFYDYVNAIKDWGVVSGNSDGTYAPSKNINRAEFAKILNLYDKRVDNKISSALSGLTYQNLKPTPSTNTTNQQTTYPTSPGVNNSQTTEKLTGKVGDELYAQGVSFKVLKFSIDVDKTTNYEGLTAGRSYYYVEFIIKNSTGQQITVHKNNILISEPDGRETVPSAFTGDSSLTDYRIVSGKSYTGKLIYSFPNQGSVNLKLGYWENKPFEVILR